MFPKTSSGGKLADLIESLCEKSIIRAVIAFDSQIPIGFSVFQIDTPESDWCKRPGWGFIREFYVIPTYRRSGTGKHLADFTEKALGNMGAKKLYLTSDDAIPFWQKCGWQLTPALCSNDQYILKK